MKEVFIHTKFEKKEDKYPLQTNTILSKPF